MSNGYVTMRFSAAINLRTENRIRESQMNPSRENETHKNHKTFRTRIARGRMPDAVSVTINLRTENRKRVIQMNPSRENETQKIHRTFSTRNKKLDFFRE